MKDGWKSLEVGWYHDRKGWYLFRIAPELAQANHRREGETVLEDEGMYASISAKMILFMGSAHTDASREKW